MGTAGALKVLIPVAVFAGGIVWAYAERPEDIPCELWGTKCEQIVPPDGRGPPASVRLNGAIDEFVPGDHWRRVVGSMELRWPEERVTYDERTASGSAPDGGWRLEYGELALLFRGEKFVGLEIRRGGTRFLPDNYQRDATPVVVFAKNKSSDVDVLRIDMTTGEFLGLAEAGQSVATALIPSGVTGAIAGEKGVCMSPPADGRSLCVLFEPAWTIGDRPPDDGRLGIIMAIPSDYYLVQ